MRHASSWLWCGLAAVLATAVTLASPALLLAANDTWKAAASGTFSTGANWTDGSAPGAGDTAQFSVAGAYTVTFTTSPTNQDLYATAGTVTFVSFGGTQTYSLTGAGGNWDIGVQAATLNLGTATTNKINLVAGDLVYVNSGGTLNIKFGSTVATLWFTGAVGTAGTLLVDGSGSNLTATGNGDHYLGWGATGNLTLQNSAGVNIAGTLNVATGGGASAVGNLTVQSGAGLSLNHLIAGTGGVAGQSATMTVTGAGSTMNLTGNMTLGAGANSTTSLNVNSSGSCSVAGNTTVYKTGTISIGGGTFTPLGNLTLDGGILNHTSGSFSWASNKTMAITNGGRASFNQSFTTPANSIINISGAGSKLEALSNYEISIRDGAQANVSSGGQLAPTGFLTLGITGTGTLVVDGAGSSASAGPGFECWWGRNGGTASATFRNNATGTFSGGLMLVSYNHSGTKAALAVESGADLSVGNLYINTQGGATTGAGTVTGAGSTITQAGASVLEVGHAASGTATLTVSSGGTFTTGTGLTTIRKTGLVDIQGGTFDANGNITIDGGALQRSTSGTFDWAASKTMTIQGGGRASFTGNFQTPDALINVTGSGSRLETLDATAHLNIDNACRVNVSGAGLVSSAGYLDIDRGWLVVDGSGSSATAPLMCWWGRDAGTTSATFRNDATGSFNGGIELVAPGAAAGTQAALSVESGADLSVGFFHINTTGGGTAATATVTGAGSTLTHPDYTNLSIGNSTGGAAVLNVLAGGAYTVQDTGYTYLYESGTINILGGSASLGQLVDLGSALNFVSGSLRYVGDLTVGTGGLLGENLTLESDRSLTLTGTTTIDFGRTLCVDGGTFNTGALVVHGAFDFERGTVGITGTGGLLVGSGGLFGASFTLGSGRTLSVTHSTTVSSGSTLAIDGGQMSARGLANAGTVSVETGGLTILDTLENQGGSRLYVGPLGDIAAGGWPTNAGRIELLGGAARLGGPGFLTNTGLITGEGEVALATLNASGGEIRAEYGDCLVFLALANQGQVTLLDGTVEGTTILNDTGGFVTGHGSLRAPGGIVNRGTVAVSSGDADFFGDFDNRSGARITVSGGRCLTFWDDVVHNGAAIKVSENSGVVFFGSYSGSGGFTGPGTVYYEADLHPGSSPATIPFGGNVCFSGTSSLEIELGGLTPGTQHDQLTIAGKVTIDDATLGLVLINSFVPVCGDRFDIMTWGSRTGAFGTVNGTSPVPGVELHPVYLADRLTVLTTTTGEKTWGVDASGNASAGSNWVGGVAPGGAGDKATFSTIISADRIVTLDAPLVVGTVKFDDNNSYTVQGPGTLTLQATGAQHAAIRVLNAHGSGAHSISANLQVGSPLDIEQNSGTAFILAGGLSNPSGRTLTKTGPGTLTVSGTQSHGAGAALMVNGGNVNLNTDAGSASIYNLAITVANDPSTVNFGSSEHLRSLALVDGTASLTAGGAKVLTTQSLTLDDTTARLDLMDNDLVVDYSGITSPVDAIRGYLASGCGSEAKWDTGLGITSSQAKADHAADPLVPTALGYRDDTAGKKITVKYTWQGDTNLDGKIDIADDYFNFLDGFNGVGLSWFYGDFNYDGSIDIANDYFMFLDGYNLQTGELGGLDGDLPSIPEPATLGLLGAGLLAAMLRRRERRAEGLSR